MTYSKKYPHALLRIRILYNVVTLIYFFTKQCKNSTVLSVLASLALSAL